MKYVAIEDGATVERDTEQDDLLLKRLEKSVAQSERQAWMREATDLLLRAGLTPDALCLAHARSAFEDGMTPVEFASRFLAEAE